jgi:hypothetical protein
LEKYLAKCRANMMTRKRSTVSLEELVAIWHRQNGRCVYCDVQMTWEHKQPVPTKLSIDRIDNNISYISGNIAMACWCCNRMKGNLSLDGFLQQCRKIVNHLGTIPRFNVQMLNYTLHG